MRRRWTAWAPAPGERRTWWMAFAVFGALCCLWALASPLLSVPDEATHLVKAAAVVRGQFHGHDFHEHGFTVTKVRAPELFTQIGLDAVCFSGKPDQPAGCATRPVGSSRLVPTNTYVGTYPPTYYLLVGWPTLFAVTVRGMYLVRLVSALLAAALLASAVTSAAAMRRSRILVPATVLAVTPMVLFLCGSVNPNGMEIAAGAAAWTSLLALGEAGRAAPNRLLLRAVVACCLLAASRPLSPLWLGLIAGVVAVALGWSRVRVLLGDRRVWIGAGVVVFVTMLALAWIVSTNALASFPGRGHGVGFVHDLHTSAAHSADWIVQMIGVFGTLDTPAPHLVDHVWLLALGGLGILALAVGRLRDKVVLFGTLALVLGLPIVLEASKAKKSGFAWQGRYTLPLAVGVPIVCAWVLLDHADEVGPVLRRLTRPLLGAFVLIQLVAHLGTARRYSVGEHGSLFYFGKPGWHPPLPTWLLALGFVVVLGVAAVWFDGICAQNGGLHDPPSAHESLGGEGERSAAADRGPDERVEGGVGAGAG